MSRENDSHGTVAERFSKFSDEEIIEIDRSRLAYTNIVYKLKTAQNTYIYKEHLNIHSTLPSSVSFKIQQHLKFPKILFHAQNYTIEEYVPHTQPDFHRDSANIAIELRRFHKNSIMVNRYIQDDISIAPKTFKSLEHCEGTRKICKFLKEFDHQEVVMCHNDLQVGNILKTNQGMRFIDYEYASMGSPLFDIANFFCEAMMDYNTSTLDYSKGYSEYQKAWFLQNYYQVSYVKNLFWALEQATVWSHWRWYLWAKQQIRNCCPRPENSLNYERYAQSRLDAIRRIGLINKEDVEEINYVCDCARFNYHMPKQDDASMEIGREPFFPDLDHFNFDNSNESNN